MNPQNNHPRGNAYYRQQPGDYQQPYGSPYGQPYQNPYQQQYQQQYQQPYQQPYRPSYRQPRTNTVGTVGFVFTLVAFFFGWVPVFNIICWLVGLICSFIGIFSAPRGLAVAGLIISCFSLILGLLFAVAIFGAMML